MDINWNYERGLLETREWRNVRARRTQGYHRQELLQQRREVSLDREMRERAEVSSTCGRHVLICRCRPVGIGGVAVRVFRGWWIMWVRSIQVPGGPEGGEIHRWSRGQVSQRAECEILNLQEDKRTRVETEPALLTSTAGDGFGENWRCKTC